MERPYGEPLRLRALPERGTVHAVVDLSRTHAVRRSVVAAAVGLLVTLAIVVVPSLRFAYRSTSGHLVLETAVTLVAGLLALLLYGRYRRSASLTELLLAYAMSLLALTALLFVTLPGLLGGEAGRAASSWAALVVRLVGAVLILLAAVVPMDRVYRSTKPVRDVLGVLAALGVLAVVTAVLASRLPDAVEVRVQAEASGQPVLDGHPLVLLVQVVNLVCYAVAAVVFTRRAARDGDDMLGWFGAGVTLGAWARVSYLLFPSLYTDWLYAGDLLRLGMYLLLLFGAVREIRHYWEAQALVAVESERRRLARDLHDGVVQELGYIRSEAHRSPDAAGVARIAAAADRALDEARRGISALTAPPDEGLAPALARAANEVGDRYDVPVHLELDGSVTVSPTLREQLVRIAREAVANAARHSRSPVVSVTLAPRRLEVSDQGEGFDPAYGRLGGFGLTSMRERAEEIGAALVVTSSPGHGTSVKVTW